MPGRVVVVGSGLAGLTAAFFAAKEGVEVLVLDRGPVGIGTNSSLANGFFAGPSEACGAENYIRDTLRAGRGINRESLVRIVARHAPSAFEFLRSMGIPLEIRGTQHRVVAADPSVIPGVVLMRILAEKVGASAGVRFIPGFCVTELDCRDGLVCGVRGVSRAGEETDIAAVAVILAAGGAGAVYHRHDNQKKILGQGYALAAQAGLALWDMEFVQFFPLVLAEPRLPALIVYPPFPRHAKLIRPSGDDILERHGLGDVNSAIIKQRDAFAALLFEEQTRGAVLLDLRQTPESDWAVHPLAILRRLRFDFRSTPVAVSPAVHFLMGGLHTNEEGETDIGGLFACGEIQWGLHGANRMGGNALTECVVSGAIAGRSAAERVLGGTAPPRRAGNPRRRTAPAGTPVSGEIRAVLAGMRETAWECAGIVRNEECLRKGLKRVEAMESRLGALREEGMVPGASLAEARAGVLTLRAIIQASLGRKESRGSFLRSDFAGEDDAAWRRNSRLSWDEGVGSFRVEYVPVA